MAKSLAILTAGALGARQYQLYKGWTVVFFSFLIVFLIDKQDKCAIHGQIRQD